MMIGMNAKFIREAKLEEELGNSLVIKEPIGVVGCVTPWNYPLHQVVCKVAPALAAGCTIVLKPAEMAPLSAFMLAEAAHEIGLPNGVLNVVSGPGRVVGEAIVAHPDVDMVSFTGSLQAGRRIASVAGDGIKKVCLELGGKSAFVVLDDAPFDKAIPAGVNNCMQNSGQTCSAWTRMLVPRSRHDEAVELAKGQLAKLTLGDPFDKNTRLGPLASAGQRDSVLGFIEQGKKEGATLVAGGGKPANLPKGFYVEPTIFANVDNRMAIAQEEIFGPVAGDHSLRFGSGCDRDRERFSVRPGRRRVGRHERARSRCREAAAHRAGGHQRRTLQRARAVRRLQEVGHRPRDRAARDRGILPAEVDPEIGMFAIFAGLAAGLLHVFSGPDHLAAIAPLALSEKPLGIERTSSRRVANRIAMGHRAHGRRAADRDVAAAPEGAAAARCDLRLQRAHRRRVVDRRRCLGSVEGQPRGHHAALARRRVVCDGRDPRPRGQLALVWRAPGAGVFRCVSDSILYLAGFGLGAIAGMSAFAAGVGLVSIRLGQFRGLLYASSAAALVIGGFWLVGR